LLSDDKGEGAEEKLEECRKVMEERGLNISGKKTVYGIQ